MSCSAPGQDQSEQRIGEFGGAWLRGHGLSMASETMGLSLRSAEGIPEPSDAARGARVVQPWHRQDATFAHAAVTEHKVADDLLETSVRDDRPRG